MQLKNWELIGESSCYRKIDAFLFWFRVMFSIDYPYDTIEQAVRWFDGITELTQKQKEQLASGNAKRLLKL
jgi:predicted TIM-barrel fold metal-dependent hydrolase